MKRFFAIITAIALSAAVVGAQDLNSAVDAFNAGAQAIETNKTEALTQFRQALEIAQTFTDEEGLELAGKCKEAIGASLLSIAKEQINDGQYDEAVATLEEAKKAAADYELESVGSDATALIPNVYLRKGSSLLMEKDFAGAATAFGKVTELCPEDGQAYLLLGQSLMQEGNINEAIPALEKAESLGKEEQAGKLLSNLYLKMGQGYLKAGKNSEAINAFEKSLAKSESGSAYKLLASAYTKSGKSAKAIETYKKYLSVEPNARDAADIMFTIAATAQKSGDKATAKEYYKKLAGSKYAQQAEAQLKVL